LKKQVGRFSLDGNVSDFIDDKKSVAPQLGQQFWQFPRSCAWVSFCTQPAAVSNKTLQPCLAAITPNPIAKWVLPVSGGPRKMTLLAWLIHAEVSRRAIFARSMLGGMVNVANGENEAVW
jgi:hypothetical protein